jgi:uncharacterized protein (TIGR02145 family)
MKFTTYIFSIALLSICNVVQAQIRVACMAGDTIELNIAQARGAVQWQASADSLVWTDITGATAAQFDYSPSQGTQWVRAAISESDCPPFYEHPVRVNAVDTTSADFDPLIIVMDTVTVQFLPDSAQQSVGQYDFEVIGTNVNIDPGDILIGTEGRGFLVSVDYLIRSNNQLVIQTHRANLDDLFDDASFDLEMLMDSLEQRDFGVQLALNNLEIVNDGNISFSFPSFNFQLTGASQWASLYSAAQGLQQFTIQSDYGLTIDGEMSLIPSSPGTPGDAEGSYSIAVFDETREVEINGKPVLYTTQVDLLIDYVIVQSGTSCELNSSFSSQSTIGYDLSYTPIDFYDVFSFDGAPGADYSFFSNEDHCNLDPAYAHYVVTFQTLVSSYFYDQRFLQVDISKKVDCKYQEWSNRWDKAITVEPVLSDDVNLEVLGISDAGDYSIQLPFPFIYDFKAPYELSLISGANQSAMADSALSEPIVLQVKDNYGEPVKDVKIWVNVSGGGATDGNNLTDSDGKVFLNWTLGNNAFDFQMLTIQVYLSDDSDILGSPLEVYAILSTACGDLTTVTDVDDNVYPVIAIGNQCWTQTNLRTTHFSDQTEIPNVTDGPTWMGLNSPAWCVFNNDEGNGQTYGKLYNWYVASDSRNACPVGWHVPSETDFYILLDAVGGNPTAGGALKSVTGWDAPNTGATNASGFTALPAGNRSDSNNGAFYSQGFYTFYWTTWNFNDFTGYKLSLGSTWSDGLMSTEDKPRGGSIRCLKD